MKNRPKNLFILIVVNIILLIIFSYYVVLNLNLKDEYILINYLPIQNQETEIENNDNKILDWQTNINSEYGYSFRYPKSFNTKYASLNGEPTVIIGANNINKDGCYKNENLENKSDTSIVEINKIQYCLSVSSEGAAGSSFITYHYTTLRDNNYITLKYVVQTTNGCGVYIDTTDYEPCLSFKNNYSNIILKPIEESVSTINFTKNDYNSFPIACTMDAKQCPDGSYVGRTGPNCEFSLCPKNDNSGILPFDSGVEGVVTIGPTCPTMREGDLSCADKPYITTIQIISVGSPNSSIFSSVESDEDGKYKIMLPPGEYSIQSKNVSIMPYCETKNIKIEPSKMLMVNILCDSGIR